MKLSLILEGIDRASRPTAAVDRGVKGLGRTARTSAVDIRTMGRRMEDATRQSTRLERAARRVGTGLAQGSRQGIASLAALDRRIQFSQAQMERLAYRSGTIIGGTLRSGLMGTTALAGAGLTATIYKVVTAGLMFEKFRTQLEGLEGSAAAGSRALGWISDFAARTPYELTEVMEAYIALKAYGIDPTDGSLRSLGDTAAGMGKSLMQAVEMIADAQTGEFERIKEFGIRASAEGDKVTFRWQRNGKEMSKTVGKTASDIKAALLGIMDQRFAGGMARLAQTTAGKWSNLMDSITRSANRVWEGGLGTALNEQITRINRSIEEMEKDGRLAKWAAETGEGLGELIDAIGDADWRAIGGGIRDVGGAIMQLAAALRALDEARNAIGDFQRGAERWTGGGILGGIEEGRYVAPRWLRDAPKPAPTRPRRVPNAPLLPAPAVRAPMKRPRPSPILPGQQSFHWPSPPKGKLEISIKTPTGTTARPTKLAAKGMDLEVNTGRAMGAIA